jgi:hypothetical protein
MFIEKHEVKVTTNHNLKTSLTTQQKDFTLVLFFAGSLNSQKNAQEQNVNKRGVFAIMIFCLSLCASILCVADDFRNFDSFIYLKRESATRTYL